MHTDSGGARVCDPQQLRHFGGVEYLHPPARSGNAAAHRAALRSEFRLQPVRPAEAEARQGNERQRNKDRQDMLPFPCRLFPCLFPSRLLRLHRHRFHRLVKYPDVLGRHAKLTPLHVLTTDAHGCTRIRAERGSATRSNFAISAGWNISTPPLVVEMVRLTEPRSPPAKVQPVLINPAWGQSTARLRPQSCRQDERRREPRIRPLRWRPRIPARRRGIAANA